MECGMIQTFRKDKYGHTNAGVLLPDGTKLNHTLVDSSNVCPKCSHFFQGGSSIPLLTAMTTAFTRSSV
jgi:hypothetical protein